MNKRDNQIIKKHSMYKRESWNLDGDGRFEIRIKGFWKKFYTKKMRRQYKKERGDLIG